MKTENLPGLRKGSRLMGGPMGILVSVETRIDRDIVLPPDRYRGTVAWKETATRSGLKRSKKRYKIELRAGDVVRWGGSPVTGGETCLIDINAEVASERSKGFDIHPTISLWRTGNLVSRHRHVEPASLRWTAAEGILSPCPRRRRSASR